MNLDLVNKLFNNANNKSTQSFITELRKYLEKNMSGIKKEEIPLLDTSFNGNKITTKFRDKMLLERRRILNDYARNTLNKGEMYYIYSKNSKMEDGYNLCICKEDKSHLVIEEEASNLPEGVEIGSVLRKTLMGYIIDEEATSKISEEIENMKGRILEEQTEFLSSNRIEGHVYEMSEKDLDRAWLFDITNNSSEGIEEIDFPQDLLEDSQEGDLFIYKEGEYQKYLE